MEKLKIDVEYLTATMLELLAIPSPSGFTDEVVHFMGNKLDALGVPYELTRRGTIRCTIMQNTADPHAAHAPACAVVAHLDTIGAMVRDIKPNGRLALMPVGTWSSRWAEGGRVTLLAERGRYRGSVLPLLASGHAYNEACDTQPVNWDQLEVRLDEHVATESEAEALGIRVGDFIAFDPNPELTESGFIVSRHLDDKAGVAAVLAALKAVLAAEASIARDCHLVFTLTEEVGSGACAVIDSDVSEVIGVDIGPVAQDQRARESGVTIPLMDSSGPHDFHLTRSLLRLCDQYAIPSHRDVFRYYHSDAGAAVHAGHDVRTALLCFGTDATHGYERTHVSALVNLAELLTSYMQAGPSVPEDRHRLRDSVKAAPPVRDSEVAMPDVSELVKQQVESFLLQFGADRLRLGHPPAMPGADVEERNGAATSDEGGAQ